MTSHEVLKSITLCIKDMRGKFIGLVYQQGMSTVCDLRGLSADTAALEWGLSLVCWQQEVLPGMA